MKSEPYACMGTIKRTGHGRRCHNMNSVGWYKFGVLDEKYGADTGEGEGRKNSSLLMLDIPKLVVQFSLLNSTASQNVSLNYQNH